MLTRFKKWLSITRSQNARLLLLLGIILFNVMLWLVSSLITYLIEPDLYGSIASSLWNSGITWMLEPGFYDPSVSVPVRILSIVVIITSMITFSGGIIAYVANLFATIIEGSQKGKNSIFIYNHILILNWNSKALELIADYRFDDDTTDIVILSDYDKSIVEAQIKRKIYDVKEKSLFKKMHIIVKEGDVYSTQDLDNVSLGSAKTIIILADEEKKAEERLDNPDILQIKSLMLIANCILKPEQTVIVEIKNEKSLTLIRDKIAREHNLENQIIPIISDEMLGRLIAQTILYPRLNQVFQELLSFEGMEFYSIKQGNLDAVLKENPYLIPAFSLNEVLYVLADSEKKLNAKRLEPFSLNKKIKIIKERKYPEHSVVIFGKNNKLPYIVDSLSWFEKDADTKVNVTVVPANDPETIKTHLAGIDRIDTILVLSDDGLDTKDYDSDVLVTLLMIQDLAKSHNAKIVLELLNPKHYDIAKSYNIENTIVSNQYLSRIITQLSKNRDLFPMYYELLTYDADNSSHEIYVFTADTVIAESFPVTFSSFAELINAIYYGSRQEYMPIGVIHDNVLDIFSGDLDHNKKIVIEATDDLVVICK